MEDSNHDADSEVPQDGDADSFADRVIRLSDDVDPVLDQIDDILSENAEEFVRSFVDKGGQGWSSMLDPSFFIGATSAGVAAAMTWDAFKLTMKRVLRTVHQVPGPSDGSLLQRNGELDPDLERMLKDVWGTAKGLSGSQIPQHTVDEAEAFHWVLFFGELMRTEGFVKVRRDHYQQLQEAAAATPEQLTPSQLVARIVDQWLHENPNANIGLSPKR